MNNLFHLAPESAGVSGRNDADADHVPIPHFGIALPTMDWCELPDKLKSKNVKFVIEQKIRVQGEVGEQATMFFLNPSGNALEFKGVNDFALVFPK